MVPLMTTSLTIASDRLTVRIDPRGARTRAIHLDGGPNLLLDADPEAHSDWAACYGGVIVGPVANRVAGGRVAIDGVTCQMPQNEGTTCLHSGPKGVHAHPWRVVAHEATSLHLEVTLPDGTCGLPGHRVITAQFTCTGETLTLTLLATTDRATPMSLAHHPYWVLGPDQHLQVPADHYLPVDASLLPTGEVSPVENTIFDLRKGGPIPPEIDHNFCLSNQPHPTPVDAATLSGQLGTLRITSTEPGLQIYGGAALPDIPAEGIRPYAGVALEPQGWPNAVNTPHFPNVIMTAETPYRQITQYTLGPAT